MKVIISTYEGYNKNWRFLPEMLVSVASFGVKNEDVCVVDNVSKSKEALDYLDHLKTQDYIVMHNDRTTYELGAYNWALDHGVKDDVYFFIQDSIELVDNIFVNIPPKLTDDNVYTLLTFECGANDHDPEDDMRMLRDYGTKQYSWGVAFNTFFCRDSVVQRVRKDWVIYDDKHGSATNERGLGIVFDRHNIEIIGMAQHHPAISIYSGYPHFRKRNGYKLR